MRAAKSSGSSPIKQHAARLSFASRLQRVSTRGNAACDDAAPPPAAASPLLLPAAAAEMESEPAGCETAPKQFSLANSSTSGAEARESGRPSRRLLATYSWRRQGRATPKSKGRALREFKERSRTARLGRVMPGKGVGKGGKAGGSVAVDARKLAGRCAGAG